MLVDEAHADLANRRHLHALGLLEQLQHGAGVQGSPEPFLCSADKGVEAEVICVRVQLQYGTDLSRGKLGAPPLTVGNDRFERRRVSHRQLYGLVLALPFVKALDWKRQRDRETERQRDRGGMWMIDNGEKG